MYNLDYGDADSVGLFQQRPSQGWGTEDQIMNPWYSAGKFYEALVKVDGWQTDTINDVAQKVQRSNFPHAYAQHEDVGRIWASALCGFDPAGVTSVDNKNATGNPEVLREFVVRVWGGAIPIAINPDGNQLHGGFGDHGLVGGPVVHVPGNRRPAWWDSGWAT